MAIKEGTKSLDTHSRANPNNDSDLKKQNGGDSEMNIQEDADGDSAILASLAEEDSSNVGGSKINLHKDKSNGTIIPN